MHLRKWMLVPVCCVATLCFGQSSSEASKAMAAGDYAKAITLYKQAAEANPENPEAWEQLGTAYQQAGRYEDARRTLQTAIDRGYASPYGKYNLACAYARLGDKQRALDLLSDLVDKKVPIPMAGDPDLAGLSSEPRYQELLNKVQALNEPCKDAQAHPEYRQLDFWVGDWNVFSGTQPVGSSSVQLILKDCVVFENWTGLTGGSGKSFNKYNTSLKKWEQFWVADSGGTIYFVGELVNGSMAYVEVPGPKKTTQRLTFTKLPDGRVRQLGEQTSDGGKTWTTSYDFYYVKKQ